MPSIEVTSCDPIRHGEGIVATVTVPGLDGLLIRVEMEPMNGRLVVTDLHLTPEPGQCVELSATVLRSVPVLRIRETVLDHLDLARETRPDVAQFLRQHQSAALRDFVERWRGKPHGAPSAARVGRPRKYEDGFLRSVALVAIETRSGVRKELARRFPELITRDNAGDAIRRARLLGFLAPVTDGRHDYQAGPRLAASGTNGEDL